MERLNLLLTFPLLWWFITSDDKPPFSVIFLLVLHKITDVVMTLTTKGGSFSWEDESK